MSKAQEEFFLTFCKWGVAINNLGYRATFGDAYRDPKVKFYYSQPWSFHGKRLAVDVNLFKDGKWVTNLEGWRDCGELWEQMGGTWGGRFKNSDPNHLSWGE